MVALKGLVDWDVLPGPQLSDTGLSKWVRGHFDDRRVVGAVVQQGPPRVRNTLYYDCGHSPCQISAVKPRGPMLVMQGGGGYSVGARSACLQDLGVRGHHRVIVLTARGTMSRLLSQAPGSSANECFLRVSLMLLFVAVPGTIRQS